MSGVFSTGTSALLAFQRALGTVGHNVANAATPGYSRQRVDFAARAGQATGAGYVGQGVDIARLQRLADGLVFARQVDSSGELGRLSQMASLAGRVDGLISDPATGLSTQWSSFFNAAKGVTADPASPIARNALLAGAEQLATRWRSLDNQLSTLDTETNQRLQAKVGEANVLAKEIASLNQTIAAAGANAAPDLLDARAQRVDQLASLVGAETLAQDDGALNVFTAGGQPLVLGNRAMTITTAPDPFRPERLQVAIEGTGGKVRLPASSISGEVGGLLEFRERVLDPARGELGRLATAFATTANATQRAGIDYNGATGTDLFTIAPPRVDAHLANTGSGSLTASVDDIATLKGNDLVLRFDGAWTATRADTGEAIPMSGTGTATDPFKVAGIALVLGGSPAVGDRYSLRPTADVAGSLRLAITDPSRIAAAAPHAPRPGKSPTRPPSAPSAARGSTSSTTATTPSMAPDPIRTVPARQSAIRRRAGRCRSAARRPPETRSRSPARPRVPATTATRATSPRSTRKGCSTAARGR
jgi:flagellar hook-associated protein 1 FlgK